MVLYRLLLQPAPSGLAYGVLVAVTLAESLRAQADDLLRLAAALRAQADALDAEPAPCPKCGVEFPGPPGEHYCSSKRLAHPARPVVSMESLARDMIRTRRRG